MELIVYKKNVYGNELVYPMCEKASLFLRALGLKTFTSQAINAAKALGYKILVQSNSVGEL